MQATQAASMPDNQDAATPQQPESGPLRLPHIMAITSGKGGVGKSSITVNLGITLARFGHRVCVLDADTGLANVNILLGIHPVLGLEDVLSGEHPIEDIMLEGPQGIKVIPGAKRIGECVNLDPKQQQRLVGELARIEPDFDYLLLDTAAGVSDNTLDFISAAHQMLLVITPEPTSLTDAFSLLRLMLRRHPVSCEVVVNMVGDIHEARSVFQRFSGAVEKYLKLKVNFLGFIQRDESLRTAVILQHPVALFPEHDPSSRSFQRLATALENTVSTPEPGQAFSQFWFRRFRTHSTDGESTPARGHPPGDTPAKPPVTAAERLDALRTELLGILGQEGHSEQVAAWLAGVHAAYWDRTGEPALDMTQMLERMLLAPDRHEQPLSQLREKLPCAAPKLAGPVTDTAGNPQARDEDRQTPPPDERPDFGIRHRPAEEALPVTRAVPRAHGYDQERFGPQQDLAERIKRLGEGGGSVLELIRRL